MRRRNPPQQDEQQQRDMLLRPPDKTFKQKTRDLFWDPINKTCLTRTPINWLAITIYYFIFLFCVLLIFSFAMVIVYFCLNVGKPQYLLDQSPIGTTPPLNFFPHMETYSLIWLSSKHSYDSYVESINKIFNGYKEKDKNFSTNEFGECSKPPFGYDKKTPCIFFRLNRIISWVPNPYKKGDDLPKEMPDDVKHSIAESAVPKIWVYCEGKTAKDRDHISPNFFQFQGSSGLSTSPYPFEMQSDFVDPIVALKFIDSDQKKILYNFVCAAWAKDIDWRKSKVDVFYYFD